MKSEFKNSILFLFALSTLFGCAQKAEKQQYVIVENSSSFPVAEAIHVTDRGENIDLDSLSESDVVFYENGNIVPFEFIDDPLIEGKSLMIDLKIPANESKKILIKSRDEGDSIPEFTKKTQAELWHREGGEFVDEKYVGGGPFVRKDNLRVPDGFMDHSYYIKYEGPGWESDKVGYRFYLDWRNAVDVFGKKIPEMVLQDVGQDGFDSYHEPSDWGMDILKVGESLGIGSIGYWDGEKAVRVAETDSVYCAITMDGLLRSQVRTDYYGWLLDSAKYSFSSFITIDAGSRMSKQTLQFRSAPGNICTGIHKDENAEYFELSSDDGKWSCIATYGEQSLAGDKLGLAVIYSQEGLKQKTEDDLNYVVVLQPENNQVEYYFMAAWEQEKEGVKTMEEFKAYLNQQLNHLSQPVTISMVQE